MRPQHRPLLACNGLGIALVSTVGLRLGHDMDVRSFVDPPSELLWSVRWDCDGKNLNFKLQLLSSLNCPGQYGGIATTMRLHCRAVPAAILGIALVSTVGLRLMELLLRVR